MTTQKTLLKDAYKKISCDFNRIVIKVGSSVLTNDIGINVERILHLAQEISKILKTGKKVVLISSGAVAYGFKKIGFSARPKDMAKLQAAAAIGQPGLMNVYEDAFSAYGYITAQVLLTASDVYQRRQYLNATTTLKTLLDWNVLPIVNENDTIATDELKFGDNDTLGSLVASMIEADLFINLSDIDGLYTADPRTTADAKQICLVEAITPNLFKIAGKAGQIGSGGMFTKITAAQRLSRVGISSIIASGQQDGTLSSIFNGIPTGTLFLAKKAEIPQRKSWIAFTHHAQGKIIIDEGATDALLNRGKSLLPSGVCDVVGHFAKDDAICVEDTNGQTIAIGLTNYNDEDLRIIMGHNSKDIQKLLKTNGETEVIHRDNMVLADPTLQTAKQGEIL